MHELISDRAADGLAVVLSLVGAAGLGIWMRRPRAAVAGAIWLLVACSGPFWILFGAMDRWWDTTTLRGMAAPYLVFGCAGLGSARLARWWSERNTRAIPAR